MAATSTANTAVMALKIAVSPVPIWIWPQLIRVNGMTLFRHPMTRKAPQTRAPRGTFIPRAATTSHSSTAAQPTRCSTTVTGPISRRAMAIEKNDAPQITDSSTSSAQARVDRSIPSLLVSATRLPPSVESRHTLACVPIQDHPDHATPRPIPQDAATR